MDDIFFDVGYATPHLMRKELQDVWKAWKERSTKVRCVSFLVI